MNGSQRNTREFYSLKFWISLSSQLLSARPWLQWRFQPPGVGSLRSSPRIAIPLPSHANPLSYADPFLQWLPLQSITDPIVWSHRMQSMTERSLQSHLTKLTNRWNPNSLSLCVLPLLISISQQKSAGGLREEKSYAFRDRKCWKRDLRVSQSTAFRSFSTQSQEDDEEVCSLHSSMTRSVPNGCDRVGLVRIISV